MQSYDIYKVGPPQNLQTASVDLSKSGAPNIDAQNNATKDIDPKDIDKEAMASAREFEAAFITQFLIHSGLSKSLTLNGGEAVEAFSNFYLEEISKKITEQGGFGLAEQVYDQMLVAKNNQEGGQDEIGRL